MLLVRTRAKEEETQQLRIEAWAASEECQAETDQPTRQKEEAVKRAEERVRAELQAEIDRTHAQYERQAVQSWRSHCSSFLIISALIMIRLKCSIHRAYQNRPFRLRICSIGTAVLIGNTKKFRF
ncbi:hypothetical protein BDR04DRAFT_600770 [Suillus decipiens]|nr:hypothetical protein BDR04DRAFT_600770 [Suillus decipiens]